MTVIHPSSPTAEILLVGDPADRLRLLSVILSENGYKVHKATNGQDAIAMTTIQTPDLILLDLALPDINGYEVCRRLKEMPEVLAIPIIFISDSPDALDRDRAFAVGGADSIAPPFHFPEVLARIRDRLALKWQQQQLHHQNLRLQTEIQERQNVEDTLYVYLHALASELRPPMAAMAALLAGWLREGLPENPQDAIAQLRQRCDRQLHRLDALLEVNDLEMWGTALDLQPVDLYELVQTLVIEWQPLLNEIPAQLQNQVDPNFPKLNADPQQLERVFNDLIDNTIQHNQPPLVIQIEAVKNNVGFVTCQVSDNGQGINSFFRDRLFNASRPTLVGNVKGSGLGLYLCQQIIQAHGGEIFYLTNPQGGTTISFTLAIAAMN
ncbi:MAG: response regulator [Spirulinaceae cyanobacterium]